MEAFDCICLWTDLLGYGSAFYQSNWNLESELAKRNIKRIANLQDEWLSITNPFNETIFTLNDGLVRNFDLPTGSFALMLMWIGDCILRFDRTNIQDTNNGFPGLRGVMSFGQRIEYISKSYQGMGEFISTSPERKSRYNEKITVYSPSELQMNTAFSKAYIMEASGSALGVTGNKLYIDYNVIHNVVNIANSGIRDCFATIDSDPLPSVEYTYSAKFCEDDAGAVLQIETDCFGERWTSFKILFERGIVYKNAKASIETTLFVPVNVEAALFGKDS